MAQPVAAASTRISTPVGAALYLGAVLGAGVLVLPGLAFRLAGPASLAAWAVDAGLGVALALLFAALASRYPGQAGVLGYVTLGLGPAAGSLAGWSYFVAAAVGQIIVPMSGAMYIAAAWHLGEIATLVLAQAVLGLAVYLNLRGLRVSGAVQLGLIAVIAAVLLGTSAAGLAHTDLRRLTPFAPDGWAAAAQTSTILFFAFSGWEAIASLSGEFRDGRRGLRVSTGIALAMVTLLYLGVGSAVVLGLPGTLAASPTALFDIWRRAIGPAGAAALSLIALVLSTSTTNAFIAGASRLGDRLAFPSRAPLPVPTAMVWGIGGFACVGILALAFLGMSLALPLAVASGLVLVTYLLCAAAGWRLLSGSARWAAGVAGLASLLVLPFVPGIAALLCCVAGALLTRWVMMRRRRPGLAREGLLSAGGSPDRSPRD